MTDHESRQRLQRYILLRGLHLSDDGRMNEHDLNRQLELHGYRLLPVEVRTLMRSLKARDAVTLEELGGTVLVAKITELGEHHMERRGEVAIEGVERPPKNG